MKILFVCLGNICRSPTAHGVVKALVAARGLDGVVVDSAGTGDWHVGKRPDPRMSRAAARRGYTLDSRARQVRARDFHDFDRIYAMDEDNLRDLARLCPPEHAHKLALFRRWDDPPREEGVPDPYYGGEEGFEEVLDIVERCGRRIVDELAGR